MTRWAIVADLDRCFGCQTCTAACKHANDTPPGVQWRRVLDIEQGTYPNVERVFLVVGDPKAVEKGSDKHEERYSDFGKIEIMPLRDPVTLE